MKSVSHLILLALFWAAIFGLHVIRNRTTRFALVAIVCTCLGVVLVQAWYLARWVALLPTFVFAATVLVFVSRHRPREQ